LFVMDGDEIDRITNDAKALTDFYPKRLGDVTAVDPSIHEFTVGYMQASEAARRFRSSRLIQQTFPDEIINAQLEPFFVIREMRYRARLSETNWLAELDIDLRGSRLHEVILEVLNTNEFRVAMAERFVDKLQPTPVEALTDLVAAALAQRDMGHAIQLLEEERNRNVARREDICLLTYLYCLNGNVDRAESIAPATPGSNGPFVKWLWGKLQAEYGFRPPASD